MSDTQEEHIKVDTFPCPLCGEKQNHFIDPRRRGWVRCPGCDKHSRKKDIPERYIKLEVKPYEESSRSIRNRKKKEIDSTVGDVSGIVSQTILGLRSSGLLNIEDNNLEWPFTTIDPKYHEGLLARFIFIFSRFPAKFPFYELMLVQKSFPDIIAIERGTENEVGIELELSLKDWDRQHEIDINNGISCDYVLVWKTNSSHPSWVRELGLRVLVLYDITVDLGLIQ